MTFEIPNLILMRNNDDQQEFTSFTPGKSPFASFTMINKNLLVLLQENLHLHRSTSHLILVFIYV